MSTEHEPAWVLNSDFARRVGAIAQITDKWVGCSLITFMCQVGADRPAGDLFIGLLDTHEGSRHLPVWLHLAQIRHLRMDDAEDAEGLWVDEVRVSWLPAERSSWPTEVRRHQLRSWAVEGEHGEAHLECEMAMVEIVGPWNMEAIAQIIDVSVTPPELESVSSLL